MTITFNDPAAFALAIAYALLATSAGYWILRGICKLNPPRSTDDRIWMSVVFFVLLFLAALAALVSLVMLFIGHAGMPALMAFGLLGAAFGCELRAL